MFESAYMPTILPDPKYSDIVANQSERHVMMTAGLKAIPKYFSNLGRACYSGNYELFLILIKIRNITNFNTYFEGFSKWSLMHFVMFGRKARLYRADNTITMQQLNQDYDYIKIAQHLLDKNLYIDIQSKWGYSSMHESVINETDLYFAEFLLQNGAQPNIKSIFGETPLHSAAKSSIDSVKLLCKYGGDPRIKCDFYGITSLFLGRNHIEISAILNNQVRKLQSSEFGIKGIKLECENISYCYTCNVSSRIKKLYLCRKCRDYNTKYCSIRCQKLHYKEHKLKCKQSLRRMDAAKRKTTLELIFYVKSAQNEMEPNPIHKIKTAVHEEIAKHAQRNVDKSLVPGSDSFKQFVKQGKKIATRKMKQKLKRHEKSLKRSKFMNKCNKIVLNDKFIVKIQTPRKDSGIQNQMLVYNKKRTYMVFIEMKKQRKQYSELSNMVRKFSANDNEKGCKAFFYVWIDKKHKLHVMIDKVLALQPW